LKSLIIIRHAKSSWDDPSMHDFDRPLNERGERDAPAMAKRLKKRDIYPQQMLSSPAVRAITTCLKFAEVLKFPVNQIVHEKAIYHAGAEALFEVIQRTKELDSTGPVLLFGHNPGLTDFVNELLDEEIDNIPTTGVVSCKLSIEWWAKARPGCGKLEFFDYPKRLK
jgi:phosphohistidine phosphatase